MLRFVSGVNCHPDTAGEEMLMVKRRFGKEGGTLAYHGYQSFAPGEATPELAHEIGIKLAQRLWGDRYQVLVATHLDKANHLHSHFVVNTVSFVDGIKYHRTKQDYKEMQRVSTTSFIPPPVGLLIVCPCPNPSAKVSAATAAPYSPVP